MLHPRNQVGSQTTDQPILLPLAFAYQSSQGRFEAFSKIPLPPTSSLTFKGGGSSNMISQIDWSHQSSSTHPPIF